MGATEKRFAWYFNCLFYPLNGMDRERAHSKLAQLSQFAPRFWNFAGKT